MTTTPTSTFAKQEWDTLSTSSSVVFLGMQNSESSLADRAFVPPRSLTPSEKEASPDPRRSNKIRLSPSVVVDDYWPRFDSKMTIVAEEQLSKPYPRESGMGAYRDSFSGELLRKRKDGRLVALRCPHCNKDKKVSCEQGHLGHMYQLHGIRMTRDEATEVCGVVLIGMRTPVPPPRKLTGFPVPRIWPDGSGIATPPPLPMPSVSIQSSSTSTPSRPQQISCSQPPRLSTPSTSAIGSHYKPNAISRNTHENREPEFRFGKPTDDGREVRVVPVENITTVQKLFANAIAGGVARPDTEILSIHISRDEPLYVVKDYERDFQMVSDAINTARTRCPTITVMRGD